MTQQGKIQRSKSGGSLVALVADKLRQAIVQGEFKPGDKLPSEVQLTTAHGVSRTVVREAVAALRSDGLVEPRQGAGVFVLTPPMQDVMPLQNVDYERISSVIEMLELRTAVEVEAAALAASRRSATQEEDIILCYRRLIAACETGAPSSEADFALHMSIAEAANNPRFVEFMKIVGAGVIPRTALQSGQAKMTPEYLERLTQEHGQIIAAISNGNPEAAAQAMRMHLKGSQGRYRAMLIRSSINS